MIVLIYKVLTELISGAMVRVIMIVLIYRGFNRAELGCYGQSYSDRVDIHVLTELSSGAMIRVIVIVLIYRF